jgi:hypothetical protein
VGTISTQPRRNEESALVVGDFIGFALRIDILSEFGVHPALKLKAGLRVARYAHLGLEAMGLWPRLK